MNQDDMFKVHLKLSTNQYAAVVSLLLQQHVGIQFPCFGCSVIQFFIKLSFENTNQGIDFEFLFSKFVELVRFFAGSYQ